MSSVSTRHFQFESRSTAPHIVCCTGRWREEYNIKLSTKRAAYMARGLLLVDDRLSTGLETLCFCGIIKIHKAMPLSPTLIIIIIIIIFHQIVRPGWPVSI
jgi:hypothetical protein